jgi:hypothetical protein
MVRIAVLVLLAAHGTAFAQLPAIRYAAMTREECEAELETRGNHLHLEVTAGVDWFMVR